MRWMASAAGTASSFYLLIVRGVQEKAKIGQAEAKRESPTQEGSGQAGLEEEMISRCQLPFTGEKAINPETF